MYKNPVLEIVDTIVYLYLYILYVLLGKIAYIV